MNIVTNYSTTIVTIFQNVIKDYERDLEEIKRIEDCLNDLNHEIELSSQKDMYKGWKLYKEIRDLRIERRRCKEEVELLKEMYEYLTSQQSQTFKNRIQQIQGNATRLREAQERRTYKPRQRTDLTIEGQTSTEQKSFEEMIDEFNKNKAYVKSGKLRK